MPVLFRITMMDTALLIKEVKRGSAVAQECLFKIKAEKMLLLCRRYVKNELDAEEIMLDGFYKFFKTAFTFTYNNEAGLQAWLKRIMINECLMFLRKKNVFTIVAQVSAEELALEEAALNNLSAAEIFNLVVQLPVGYRTVFNLYVIEGIDHKEIAGLLSISESTSKSQLCRAKTLLQKLLLKQGIGYERRKTY